MTFDDSYEFTVVERFLRYVKIDTQSDHFSKTSPSTEKQKDLSKLLAQELKDMGAQDVELTDVGYVFATIPATSEKNVPVIGFLAHVDTAPDNSGKDVKPIVHENYQGEDIKLPKDNQIIKVDEFPYLKEVIGSDIITSDGSTLLGADDKAGVAEIMDLTKYLLEHPEIKHGKIRIAFTTDEEVGRGTEHFDVKVFGANVAYTLDGSRLGEFEYETFNARNMMIYFKGKNTHSGYAKGVMINAMRSATAFLRSLPEDHLTPETTEGKQGMIHPNNIEGDEEETRIQVYLRDFELHKLDEYESLVKLRAAEAAAMYPGTKVEFITKNKYRNMKEKVDEHPEIIENANEALKRLDIVPITDPVRGGTDGCNLSYMGLPTPNLFCGSQNFHSKTEWVAVRDMIAAVKAAVTIAEVFEEKA